MHKSKNKRQTVYMPPGVHWQVKILAVDNDTTQQDLFREAMNDLFEKYGVKSWEQMEESGVPDKRQATAA